MNIIPVSVTRYEQMPGIEGCYKAVSDASHVCYQTETKKDPKVFVDMLMSKGHTRPLEFGTVYLCVTTTGPIADRDFIRKQAVIKRYMNNKYSTVMSHSQDNVHINYYITSNLCVLAQGYAHNIHEACEQQFSHNWFDDLKYWCEPCAFHDRRYTYDLVLSRGVMDDLRTHITLSSLAESTRYCNYEKEKFGSQLTFIQPYWKPDDILYKQLINYYQITEKGYLYLIRNGAEPQMAKRVLPLGIKSELMLCGNLESWENFLWRRCDSHADPEAQKIANLIKEDLYGRRETQA